MISPHIRTLCVAGKNNIAVDVCEYASSRFSAIELWALPNSTDTGEDSFQKSFLKYARSRNLRIVSEKEVREENALLFLSLEYNRIIRPKDFLSERIFNIHFSLLPKYRGMYTSALPILHGERESGVTLHKIDNGIDTGDIVAQRAFPLAPDETCRSLYFKYIEHGTALVREHLDALIFGNEHSFPQPVEGATYFSKRTIDYKNLTLDLRKTACEIDRQIRAYSFEEFQRPKIGETEILSCEILRRKSEMPPGKLLSECEDFFDFSSIDYDVRLHKHKKTFWNASRTEGHSSRPLINL